MKVKDRYWEVENSIRFANPEKATRPLLCEPKVSEDGVRTRGNGDWRRDRPAVPRRGGGLGECDRHSAQLGRREGRRRLAAHRCERHRGLDHDPVHGMQGRGAYRPDRHGSRTSGVMAARHGRRPLARPQRICAGGSEMSNAYERRGAQLNMESLYIRHDVISERKLARLNPDRPVSFRADQAVSRFGTTLGRCPLGLRSSVTHRHF